VIDGVRPAFRSSASKLPLRRAANRDEHVQAVQRVTGRRPVGELADIVEQLLAATS